MDKSQDKPNKCYCARCFMPIVADDNVNIEGQHYHKICSMCCICRQVPKSLKTFYGHVFCQECFKRHVLRKFCGDCASPSAPRSRWWMQWAPAPAPAPRPAPARALAPAPAPAPAPLGSSPRQALNKKCCINKEKNKDNGTVSKNDGSKEALPRKCFCARCLQSMDGGRVDIEGQSFHEKCANCYCCHRVPTSSPKIFNGKVFCAACYRLLMNLDRKQHDNSNNNNINPEQFYRERCEQCKIPPAAAHVKQLMAGNTAACCTMTQRRGGGGGGGGGGGAGRSGGGAGRSGGGWPADDSLGRREARPPAPAAVGLHAILPPQPPQPPPPADGIPTPGPALAPGRARALAATLTGVQSNPEPARDWATDGSAIDEALEMTEKIKKLTKLLQRKNNTQTRKKWKNFDMVEFQDPLSYGWVDMQQPLRDTAAAGASQRRPRCLWQCGVLNCYYVNNECDICGKSNHIEPCNV